MPVIEPSFDDAHLKNIIQYYGVNPEEMEKELHAYAKRLLEEGKVKRGMAGDCCLGTVSNSRKKAICDFLSCIVSAFFSMLLKACLLFPTISGPEASKPLITLR